MARRLPKPVSQMLNWLHCSLMKAERVVLDTNVLISAALQPEGTPRTVLDTIRSQGGSLLFCEQTFEEFCSRFRRPKFDRYISRENRELYFVQLVSVSEVIVITGALMGCRDPDDDKFLELALLGDANCLVTGDQDLLEMAPFGEIEILRPIEFLSLFPNYP